METYIRLTMTWTDVLDILIVAYLIYRLMLLMRNTTAAWALKGIAIFMMALFISGVLSLRVLNYVMSTFMQVGLLAIVIVFQPELRKMLEQLGASRFVKLTNKDDKKLKQIDAAIWHTVEACREMSEQRCGALIIFERGVFLTESVKSGTVLDAEVSAMLLKSVFFPNSAMHDGAVIIRDGRILAAGCVLPLTTNNTISRELGMRHRAGIGMSEKSDAIAVIVSEESGTISMALGGMLKRYLTPESLSSLLAKELLGGEPQVSKGVSSVLGFMRGKKRERKK